MYNKCNIIRFWEFSSFELHQKQLYKVFDKIYRMLKTENYINFSGHSVYKIYKGKNALISLSLSREWRCNTMLVTKKFLTY